MQLFSLHKNPRFLVTALTALIQGFVLGWLHTALRDDLWPAKSHEWLLALSVVAVLVPLTVQLMSEFWRQRAMWLSIAAMGAAFFYFGWYFGADVAPRDNESLFNSPNEFGFICSVALLWLHALPFLRARLVAGRWRFSYTELFASAWQQAIMLAEAALFTGLFWALLGLWAVLFKMLGYEFFKWLFTEPAFAYPFTTVAFGVALFLTGSMERIVTVVREQLLGLLKWLAPVAGLILILFAPTLLFKLPDLMMNSERAISAAWLLWLMAFTVLLVNAGYQNGHVEQPYPRFIAVFLRIVMPATIIVSATALYALLIRLFEYGITVDRFFAVIAASCALVYAIGYTLAALRRGPWMRGIERVNIGLAVAIVVVLSLTLTPLASPYRLSANSQTARAVAYEGEVRRSALVYLRFNTGAYGQRALERLAKLPDDGKQTESLARQAQRMLKRDYSFQGFEGKDPETVLAQLKVYPAGREVPPQLKEALKQDIQAGFATYQNDWAGFGTAGLFVDLNADGAEDFALISYPFLTLFSSRSGAWRVEGARMPNLGALTADDMKKALESGDFAPVESRWRDLRVGKHRIRIDSERIEALADKPPQRP